jgi:two-component system, OmpR family, sensor histidine kinase SenX3
VSPIRPQDERKVNSSRLRLNESPRATVRPVSSTVLAAAVIVVLIVGLVVVTAAYVRMNRDVERIIVRLGMPVHDRPTSRVLYRGVRQLERRANAAEAELDGMRTAVDETALGIVIVGRDGEVAYANPAAEVVLAGRAGEAMLRRNLLEVIAAARDTGQQQHRDVDLYAPSRRLFRIRAVPSEPGGTAVAYVRDLSEQVRVEELRRDFVANAGHELKTPLGALALLAEALVEEHDDERRKRLAERVTLEARRLADVVGDILELGAVEGGTAPFEPVLISDVVDAALDRVALAADSTGIVVERDNGAVDVWVEGSREQLVSAVANLLDNAIKFSPGRTAIVTCTVSVDDGEVAIAVRDEGIGIAEQHRDRVFERFYRVDRARSRDSGGTGLGLSIVRNVAKTHGGSVGVDSELGAGSTFTLRIPVLERGDS